MIAKPLVLCVSDVDDFKFINDNLGHAAGDDVLRKAADALRSFLRPPEFVGRFGGDEFVYVYFAEDKDVFSRLDEMKNMVCKALNEYTLSAGAAVLDIDGNDFLSLYQCADERLYENKRRRQKLLSTD